MNGRIRILPKTAVLGKKRLWVVQAFLKRRNLFHLAVSPAGRSFWWPAWAISICLHASAMSTVAFRFMEPSAADMPSTAVEVALAPPEWLTQAPSLAQDTSTRQQETPSPPPEPAASAQVESASDNSYWSIVRSMIAHRLRYPNQARPDHLEGRVVLRLCLQSDGRLIAVDIAESSAPELLAEAALKAVLRAAPFPAATNDFAGGELTALLPVRFDWDDSTRRELRPGDAATTEK